VDSLVGQKGLKLKVNNPDDFNFDPRSLLVNILSMYANMAVEGTFLRWVVLDTRSFKIETFEKAVKILNNPKKGVQVE
jgi:ubiquitin conjugation factor E4 B